MKHKATNHDSRFSSKQQLQFLVHLATLLIFHKQSKELFLLQTDCVRGSIDKGTQLDQLHQHKPAKLLVQEVLLI